MVNIYVDYLVLHDVVIEYVIGIIFSSSAAVEIADKIKLKDKHALT